MNKLGKEVSKVKRDYDTEIIQALKLRLRDGLSLQKDLHISPDRICDILEDMEYNKLIHWDGKKLVWQVS